MGLSVVTERELLRGANGLGAVPVRGVFPWGLLHVSLAMGRRIALESLTCRGSWVRTSPRRSTAARVLNWEETVFAGDAVGAEAGLREASSDWGVCWKGLASNRRLDGDRDRL